MVIKERNTYYDDIIKIERVTIENSRHDFIYIEEIWKFSEDILLRIVKILNFRVDSEEIINYLYENQENRKIVEKVKNKMLENKENKEKERQKMEEMKKENTIDWKGMAQDIYDELKKEIELLEMKPSLKIIIVWNNPESLSYVGQKKKKAEYVWIDYEKISFDDNVTEKELLSEIEKLNNDERTDWFMIQLPLPEYINKDKIINAINPEKDVDWFHAQNQWKIVWWHTDWLEPCTPAWVIKIIEKINFNLKWKIVTVLWKGDITWKPMVNFLMNKWATVIVCDIDTPDIYKFTRDSDMVITAVWKPGLIKAKHIKNNSVVIDVWITVLKDWKITWDCDFDSIIKSWGKITPVPGWVWPMTVAMLMKNTLKAYKNNNK